MRPLTPRYAGLLIVVVLLALTAQGATVPHTHTGAGVGLFNQEHDLTLLATAGTAAPLPVTTLLFVAVVFVSLCMSAPSAPIAFVSRDAESRAPPA
jgi:hypothetical protein